MLEIAIISSIITELMFIPDLIGIKYKNRIKPIFLIMIFCYLLLIISLLFMGTPFVYYGVALVSSSYIRKHVRRHYNHKIILIKYIKIIDLIISLSILIYLLSITINKSAMDNLWS